MEGNMTLDPAHQAELEQRKADVHRRILALETVHNSFTVPPEDPPAELVSGLGSIWSDLQTLKTEAQGFSVPAEDPPAGAVATLQGFELTLHDIETRLLNPSA